MIVHQPGNRQRNMESWMKRVDEWTRLKAPEIASEVRHPDMLRGMLTPPLPSLIVPVWDQAEAGEVFRHLASAEEMEPW